MKDEIIDKVFVTKYALTKGVLIYDNARLVGGGMIAVKGPGWRSYYHVGEWERTSDEAKANVDAMISHAKVAAERKLARLQKMDAAVIVSAARPRTDILTI